MRQRVFMCVSEQFRLNTLLYVTRRCGLVV